MSALDSLSYQLLERMLLETLRPHIDAYGQVHLDSRYHLSLSQNIGFKWTKPIFINKGERTNEMKWGEPVYSHVWERARHGQLLEALNLLLTTEEQDLMLLQMELTEHDSIPE